MNPVRTPPTDREIDDFLEQTLRLNGQEIQERPSWLSSVTEESICRFADGTSDDNPLWLDRSYGPNQRSGRLTAPPAILASVLYPMLHGKSMPIRLASLVGSVEYRWFHPVIEGDSLRGSNKQLDASEVPSRGGRRMIAITSEARYQNQRDELVAVAHGTVLRVAGGDDNMFADRPIARYSQAEIEEITAAFKNEATQRATTRYGRDVYFGDETPPLVRGPLALGDLIWWRALIGLNHRAGRLGTLDALAAQETPDINPATGGWVVPGAQDHEDYLLASRRGMPAPFDNGVMRFAWIAPLLTNWMGREGLLEYLNIHVELPVLYGDCVWYHGTVSDVQRERTATRVKLNIKGVNQLGEQVTTGKAEVSLPTVPMYESLDHQQVRENHGTSLEQTVPAPDAPHSRTQFPDTAIATTATRLGNTDPVLLPQIIKNHAIGRPHAPALRDDSRLLTYGELDRLSDGVARTLREKGVGPSTIVALFFPRSLEQLIGAIGILKAGGSYLPLDPDYPQERVNWVLRDAHPQFALVQDELVSRLAGDGRILASLPADYRRWTTNRAAIGDTPVNPADPAYVIYTSGSTGRHKGVQVNHGSLAAAIRSLQEPLGVDGNDVYLHTASMMFSSSVRQLFLPLANGASVVLLTGEERQNPRLLMKRIKADRVTIWETIPSLWRHTINELAHLETDARVELLDNDLQRILLTGEPLSWSLPFRWRHELGQKNRIVNLYSQTETVGTVSTFDLPLIPTRSDGIVPLGHPTPGVTIRLLTEEGQSIKNGEPGEICVISARLADGYFQQPELTAQKFFEQSDSDGHPTALYRTGDRGRLQPDGTLAVLGRLDRQAKVRGYRVEPAEIEAVLSAHADVTATAVKVWPQEDRDATVVAYVESSRNPPAAELRSWARRQLPDYLVPMNYVVVDALPRLESGKIDYARLAYPDHPPDRPDYQPACSPVEQLIAEIWEDVLNVPQVSRHDDFFELGGYSLVAVQLLNRLRDRFSIDLSLRSVFDRFTVAAQAEVVEAARIGKHQHSSASVIPCAKGDCFPLSSTQQRIWLLCQFEQVGSAYNLHYALRIRGPLLLTSLQQAAQIMVARHDMLRARFILRGEQPMQEISPRAQWMINTEIGTSPEEDRLIHALRLAEADAAAPFDLEHVPLIRAFLVALGDNDNLLYVTMHHLVSDGWSSRLLLRELLDTSERLRKDEPLDLPELPIRYVDFVAWQRSQMNGPRVQRQLSYWRQQLDGIPPYLNLPTDRPRPRFVSYHGSIIVRSIPETTIAALRRLAAIERGTLQMTILAAFKILLFRYTGTGDIVIGSATAGRNLTATEGLVGPLVGLLVLRTRFSADSSFRGVVRTVRECVLQANDHQDVPFEMLVNELKVERPLNRAPLCQACFVFLEFPRQSSQVGDLKVEFVETDNRTSKFDLTLLITERDGRYAGKWEFNSDLFYESTIQQMATHFETLLAAMAGDPDSPVGNLPAGGGVP